MHSLHGDVMKRTHLSSAIGLVLGLAFIAPLQAQQAGNSTSTPAANAVAATQLETVKVTARKREETLQDVPIVVGSSSTACGRPSAHPPGC